MKDGSPNSGTDGLFSSLKKALKKRKNENVTEEEILGLVNEGHESGVLKENEAEMISNIFDFSEKVAHEIMTHRKDIEAFDCELTLEEAFQIIAKDGYSRYPVYEEDIDNILGILHLHDLIHAYSNLKNREKTLKELKDQVLIEPYFIPETRNISLLFKEMQVRRIHMAVVVDEYGQTAGIVTMEDIIEEIVGNIQDEHDEEEADIIRQSDEVYFINGRAQLEDIGKELGIEFDVEDIDTCNGFMTDALGRIPKKGDKFETEYDGWKFEILAVKDRMVSRVKATKLSKNDELDS